MQTSVRAKIQHSATENELNSPNCMLPAGVLYSAAIDRCALFSPSQPTRVTAGGSLNSRAFRHALDLTYVEPLRLDRRPLPVVLEDSEKGLDPTW